MLTKNYNTITDIEISNGTSHNDEISLTFGRVVVVALSDCVRQFSVSHIQEIIMQCQEISHGELDLIILGQLQAFGNDSDSVCR